MIRISPYTNISTKGKTFELHWLRKLFEKCPIFYGAIFGGDCIVSD
jgi:hypothetical protein